MFSHINERRPKEVEGSLPLEDKTATYKTPTTIDLKTIQQTLYELIQALPSPYKEIVLVDLYTSPLVSEQQREEMKKKIDEANLSVNMRKIRRKKAIDLLRLSIATSNLRNLEIHDFFN